MYWTGLEIFDIRKKMPVRRATDIYINRFIEEIRILAVYKLP
jgi:hypothetical protein